MRLSITLFSWLACGKVWECPSLAKFCSNNFVRQQSLYLDPINSYWDILWVRQISEKPWETYMSFCLLQALDGPLLHGNMITCSSFSVFLLILVCKGPNMSIALLLNTLLLKQCSVSESDSSFDFAISCRSHIYQLLVWPYFAHPRSETLAWFIDETFVTAFCLLFVKFFQEY